MLIILDYNSGPTILPHSLLLSTSCIVVCTDKPILLDLQFGRLQSLFQLQQNSPKTDASQIMLPKIFYITSSPILRAPPFSVHSFVKSGTAFQQSFLECFRRCRRRIPSSVSSANFEEQVLWYLLCSTDDRPSLAANICNTITNKISRFLIRSFHLTK